MITDFLYSNASAKGDKPFLIYGDESYSYSAMAGLVSRFASELSGMGVRRGSKVALICGNRPAFLVAWFAISELGAVAVPLNVSLVGDGLRYTLRQSESELLLIEPSAYQEKEQDLRELESHLKIVQIEDRIEQHPGGEFPRWIRNFDVDSLSPNSILYTSGTTGLPKGAVLPHQAYIAAGHDMVHSLGVTAEERILVFLPLFHANPQMYAVTSTLVAGATMILLPRFSASRFFDDVRHYEATGFTFVGTVLSILEKQYPEPQGDHQLRWCVGGGAPKRVWEELEVRFGVRVNELYGMTETGGWVTMNTEDQTRLGSVGRPRRNVEICIRDLEGRLLPVGEKGEITARSAEPGMFFTEYLNNPEATASTLKDGWLHTGDRGFLDEDGYLYFDGRLKELIRRAGEMISPTEIEQQMLKHPSVKDCAVVGVPDDITGEEVKAVIVAREQVAPDDLLAFLDGRIPRYMMPRYFTFVSEIPKTETQKIKRHELSKLDAPVLDTKTAART